MIYEIADFSFDTDRRVLSREGAVVPIEPQVFDLIRHLAENAGRVVSKDELTDAVWNGRIVSDATISARINAARVALGDDGKRQAVIRTVPRRGVEMVADVAADSESDVDEAALPTPEPELRQTIRYTYASDGLSLAWSSAGLGPPVLIGAHHLSNLERDFTRTLLGPGFQRLARNNRIVRYDIRGTGLSDPITGSDALDKHVGDMLAVADATGLERFPIVACLQSAVVAIRLAAEHPHRVSRLVIQTGYARGRNVRGAATDKPTQDPLIALLESGGWGDTSNGFMRAWVTMILPHMSVEEISELIHLICDEASPEDALAQRAVIDSFDVTGDLARVQCPALVIHARNCSIHPVAEGRRLAAGINGGEFLEVDSANTFCVASDPSFDQQIEAVFEFLARGEV